MWARYVFFIVGSFAILMINMWVMSYLYPQAQKPKPAAKPVARQGGEKGKTAEAKMAASKPSPKPEAKKPAGQPEEKKEEKEAKLEAEPKLPAQWATLGSADPSAPYRMLVTLTNRGAAVERIELNSDRFRELEDGTGYLGHLAIEPTDRDNGVLVQVVGDGTPAAKAGLKKGDLITAIAGQKIRAFFDFTKAMARTKPRQTISLEVLRNGKTLTLPVGLTLHPLQVIQPEGTDPLSFLLTMHQIDKLKLADLQTSDEDAKKNKKDEEVQGGFKRRPDIGRELEGLDLRNGTWALERSTPTEAVFSYRLPKWGLEIVKTYRLAEVPKEALKDTTAKAYHLVFDVKIRNTGDKAREVAYQLDGPTGLPIEGYWYASKVSPSWSASGLRDVVVSLDNTAPKMITAPRIAADDLGTAWKDPSLTYVGVDAQYFSSVLIPRTKDPAEVWFAEGQPLRVGPVNMDWQNTVNTSFRLISQSHRLKPGDEFSHSFTVFTGPKRPALLAQYGLKELVYYGWFWWVAIPMSWILHTFYAVVGNYGIAIILLTVVVRSGMFPLSRKQALSAQKMQELQPEIKKLSEKYKNNPEGRMKAQQELFKKHKYNPAGGCLIVFLQLPIFVGLYNSLRVDVELRQAPLISESLRWCSNLAAPDMLFNWTGFMPEFVSQGHGFFGMGPYFNLLPILTVVLFLWQQKMFMPPPADEQAAMQQNMMQFMMIFMGLMFFKVASGLCIYFIASSLWSLAERKYLPKAATATAGGGSPGTGQPVKPSPTSPSRPSDRDGGEGRKNRSRKR
jgi:YidC/Oxa1 family membrane protein insertase